MFNDLLKRSLLCFKDVAVLIAFIQWFRFVFDMLCINWGICVHASSLPLTKVSCPLIWTSLRLTKDSVPATEESLPRQHCIVMVPPCIVIVILLYLYGVVMVSLWYYHDVIILMLCLSFWIGFLTFDRGFLTFWRRTL